MLASSFYEVLKKLQFNLLETYEAMLQFPQSSPASNRKNWTYRMCIANVKHKKRQENLEKKKKSLHSAVLNI